MDGQREGRVSEGWEERGKRVRGMERGREEGQKDGRRGKRVRRMERGREEGQKDRKREGRGSEGWNKGGKKVRRMEEGRE